MFDLEIKRFYQIRIMYDVHVVLRNKSIRFILKLFIGPILD